MAKKTEKRYEMGWKEWAALPELGVPALKVKIDTGARTSALQASNIRYVTENDVPYVLFECHPIRRSKTIVVTCKAPLLERRHVKNSGGTKERRPVIKTHIQIGAYSGDIEVTLTDRKKMKMRMLVGRQALKNKCIVNPGKAFITGKKTIEWVKKQYEEVV